MAEQTIERLRSAATEIAASEESRGAAMPHLDTAEALRQARTCLDTSNRRLRRGDAEQADEVLKLLQNATDLLQDALFPHLNSQGAE